MTREMMPLRDAIGCLADMHEAERNRIEAWAEDAAPKIAAELGIPVEQMRAALDLHLARHVATLGDMIELDAADLAAPSYQDPSSSTDM